MRATAGLATLLLLGGCSRAIDGYLVKNPIAQTLTLADIDLACRSANANVPLALGISERKPPNRALVILQVTSALCSELNAMEAELQAERAWVTLTGERRVSEVTDARTREQRHRAITAMRLERAVADLESEFGPIGGSCPKMRKPHDELTLLLGLVGGAAALLQDQASGGAAGVTTDRLRNVARSATCLDDDTWWHVPEALRAGAWAMVPGSGPEGVDPWQALDQAAERGQRSGVRIARAVQVQLLANAGRTQDLERAIAAFAQVQAEPDPAYKLLDVHAGVLVQHQADLLWVKERGHRAPAIAPPSVQGAAADPQESLGPDPFGDDPFASEPASDPFAPTGDSP